jgi:hypothetical protein
VQEEKGERERERGREGEKDRENINRKRHDVCLCCLSSHLSSLSI